MKSIINENHNALEALALMWEQYCPKGNHLYMTAGETAEVVLQEYDLLKGDGSVDWDKFSAPLSQTEAKDKDLKNFIVSGGLKAAHKLGESLRQTERECTCDKICGLRDWIPGKCDCECHQRSDWRRKFDHTFTDNKSGWHASWIYRDGGQKLISGLKAFIEAERENVRRDVLAEINSHLPGEQGDAPDYNTCLKHVRGLLARLQNE